MNFKATLLFLLVLITSISQADMDCQITNPTPVTGLSLDSGGLYTASMTFGWQHSSYVVGANRLTIDVEGCGATATSNPLTWKFNEAGEVTVTMTWTAWRMPAPYGPPGAYTATDTRTYYIIGGKVELSEHQRTQPREQRTGVSGIQPVILDYFGNGDQTPHRATFKAALAQPGGVTYQWTKSGPMAIDGSSTGSSAKFYATGGSGRAGANPTLAFTKVYEGQTYTMYDCTPSAEKAISCHAPEDVRFYDADTTSVTNGKRYLLYVVSNIGDPLREVNFQERYPDNYIVNGTPFTGGVPPNTTINANGSPFVSGDADEGLAHPGYSYMAKDDDYNIVQALPGTPTPFTLTVYQWFYGGTSVNTGTTGILIGRFQIDLTSSGVTRTKLPIN